MGSTYTSTLAITRVKIKNKNQRKQSRIRYLHGSVKRPTSIVALELNYMSLILFF